MTIPTEDSVLWTERALQRAREERQSQRKKWGDQALTPSGTGPGSQPIVDVSSDASVATTLAQFAKENTDRKAENGTLTWADILLEEVLEAFAEEDPQRLREELDQVAAVAVAWSEKLDRGIVP